MQVVNIRQANDPEDGGPGRYNACVAVARTVVARARSSKEPALQAWRRRRVGGGGIVVVPPQRQAWGEGPGSRRTREARPRSERRHRWRGQGAHRWSPELGVTMEEQVVE
jgi:hypothetical protein